MTYQDVVNIGYARNKRAKQGEDATPEELIEALQDIMGRYFSIGQRVNLEWFTEDVMLDYDEEKRGWLRPKEAESVHLILMNPGEDDEEEVSKVPFDNQGAEKYKPALYRIRGIYRIAASPDRKEDNPLTATSQLQFFYTRRPHRIESLEQPLDEMWPEGHETVLGVEVGLFLARKDNREQDAPALEAQRKEGATWFAHFLQHEDRGTVYPQDRVRKWAYGMSMPAEVSP